MKRCSTRPGTSRPRRHPPRGAGPGSRPRRTPDEAGDQPRELGVRRQVIERRRPGDPCDVGDAVPARQRLHVGAEANAATSRSSFAMRDHVALRGRREAQREVGIAAREIRGTAIVAIDLELYLREALLHPRRKRREEVARDAGRRGDADHPLGFVSARSAVRFTSAAHSAMRRAGSTSRSPKLVERHARPRAARTADSPSVDSSSARRRLTVGCVTPQPLRRRAQAPCLGDGQKRAG